MSSEVCDICILVLIGVPGCGKTSFCQNYRSHLESQKLNLVHVCYDDLILRERQAELATNNDEHGKWKLERNDIVTAVDVLISEMKGTNITSVDQKVKNLVAKIPKPDQHSGRIVVVIDDNNYLPSMRHQYYQLARKHLTGFCQLYFHCQRETAKLLNGGRKKEDQVPEHVIDQINDKIEEPNPLKNNWECFSFSISIEATEIPRWNFEMVDNVVNLGFGNPVQPHQDNTEEREAARVICSASLVHQADKYLRKLVNKKMTAERKNDCEKEDMKVLSTKLYDVKTELLEDLRTGFSDIDDEVVKSFHSNNQSGSKLEDEISRLFELKMDLKQ